LLAVVRTWAKGHDHRGQLVGAHNFRYDLPRMCLFGSSQCLAPVGLVVRARKLGICLAGDGAAAQILCDTGQGWSGKENWVTAVDLSGNGRD
jgi:hypothetical protein